MSIGAIAGSVRHLLAAVALMLLLPLSVGCGGKQCNTPFGDGAELDLLQPDFVNLYNNPGGTLVINRGHKGIIVSCTALGEYAAFECTCPVDHDTRMLPDDDRRATLLTCPVCKSSFELTFGLPITGSVSECPLFRYNTAFDGRFLVIY